jgi:hypothetical protein
MTEEDRNRIYDSDQDDVEGHRLFQNEEEINPDEDVEGHRLFTESERIQPESEKLQPEE